MKLAPGAIYPPPPEPSREFYFDGAFAGCWLITLHGILVLLYGASGYVLLTKGGVFAISRFLRISMGEHLWMFHENEIDLLQRLAGSCEAYDN